MPDPIEVLTQSVDALKESFGTKVEELKTALGRVEAQEATIEDMKVKVLAGEATIEELKEAKEEVKELRRTVEERNGALTEAVEKLDALSKRVDEAEAASKRLPLGGGEEALTVGQRFVESDAYKGFNTQTDKVSGAAVIGSFWKAQRDAVAQKAGEITGASLGNVASYLYSPTRVPGIIGPPELMPRVRDLFPVLSTAVGAIEFVRETGFTNAAAPTAEVDAKPQSALTFESVSIPVRTLAHWLPCTRQILADATQLQQYIDTRLLYGLALTEDDELLNGDGTGAHLTGLLTDTDIQTLSQGATDNKADAVRRAMTLGEVAGYPATGSVMHPNDWEDIELLKDEQGRYIWANVQQSGIRRLWGQPVVTTVAIDELSFATGAFALAAAIWDREDSAVRVSDQHSDFFTKNLVAILAEERIALTVYRPEAIVLGTFSAAGS